MQCKFFFNDTATTEIYTLSLHDALPICDEVADAAVVEGGVDPEVLAPRALEPRDALDAGADHVEALDLVPRHGFAVARSEEHTSELQSRQYLVCRLLLENNTTHSTRQFF